MNDETPLTGELLYDTKEGAWCKFIYVSSERWLIQHLGSSVPTMASPEQLMPAKSQTCSRCSRQFITQGHDDTCEGRPEIAEQPASGPLGRLGFGGGCYKVIPKP